MCKVPATNRDVGFKSVQKNEGTPGRAVARVLCHSLVPLCGTGHAWWDMHLHVWCLAQGHRITACPAPCCARSPFSGVRHHPAGVSSTLIQEALQGVFRDWGVGWGGFTQKSLSLSRHRAVLISEGWGGRGS